MIKQLSHLPWALLGTIALAIFGFRGFTTSESDSPTAANASLNGEFASVSNAPYQKPIEQVLLGERVLAMNPDEELNPNYLVEPDSKTWSRVAFELQHPASGTVTIKLLRPHSWVQEMDLVVGESSEINLPELGISGSAKLLSLEACPDISPGNGHVVTGWFKHMGDNLVDVSIEDNPAIGCTATHPFWSEDRQDFVEAGLLRPGERLLTHDDRIVRVTQVLPRPGPSMVYNLEVNLQHTYHVGANGALVHNMCKIEQLRDAAGRFLPKNGDELVPGSIGEQKTWDAIKKKTGWRVVERRVHARDATGQLRVYDGIAISPKNRVIGLETKSRTARRTKAQRDFDTRLNSNSSNKAVGVGKDIGIEIERSIEIRQ